MCRWRRPFRLSPAEGCFGEEKAPTFRLINSYRVKLKTGEHRQSFPSEPQWEQEWWELTGENRRTAEAEVKSKPEQTHCEPKGD